MTPREPTGGPVLDQLAAFTAGLRLPDVPADVQAAAQLHVLDTLGCGLGAVGTGAGAYVSALLASTPETGACHAIGSERLLSVADAAFGNAALCHALDFDDTHGPSICHISTVVVPAALATAELTGADGARTLAAIVAGSEVVARVGALAVPAYMKTGFHHTGVCGAFGATAAAASLLGLDAERTREALGICGSLASGSLEFLGDGSTTKIVNAGGAARAGVLAARLAQHGGDGPRAVLEGRFGLFASFFRIEDVDLRPAARDLGTRWETPASAFKLYPACHFVHSSLDATRIAATRLGVLGTPDAVTSIDVEVPAPALPIVLEPRADKIAPRTPYEGKFSLQYSVAAMVSSGAVTVESYLPEAMNDPACLRLAARVTHRAAEFETFPASFPARVTVRRGATSETVEAPVQRGGPEAPLEAGEVIAKFRANAGLALDDDDAQAVVDGVLAMDAAGRCSTFLAPLARAQRTRG